MARSTRTSLAGQVASVARKAVSRHSAPPDEDKVPAAAPGKKAATKKAPAKKAPAKRAPAKRASSATAAGKKAAAQKSPAQKSPAQKSATKATKATPAKKASVKKTASTKSAASASAATAVLGDLAVKEGEDGWTKAELEGVLEELHEQRDHSAEILEHQESELSGLMRDAGDGAGHDQADMGATSFERDHELTVLNIEREKVAQIDRALARIDDGTYGVCESCGNPIGKMRVMAFPRATLCMTCKQREERR
jgi:DnaK suppressor protein